MGNLVLLTTVSNEIEAEIIKQKLAEAGIESMMEAADTDSMLPSLDYSRGVGLYVEEEDFEVAQGMIGSGEDDLDDDMEIGVGD
ncbi:MAG TPA: DUF2007 domain-containing protein [Candidatus Kapabacteria bacterium]|nr:DUF2007 domain-containing protein [Candidatus Kapabacteria bacterium]